MINRFSSIKIAQYSGLCVESFSLNKYWDAIREQITINEPFYSTEDWRCVYKVLLDPEIVLYVKVIHERRRKKGRLLSILTPSEAMKYYSSYRFLTSNNITSPNLLFILEERKKFIINTIIIATLELRGYESWPSFFEFRWQNKDFQFVKNSILLELSRLTAKMHGLGLYFSMDGRNIFVRSIPIEGNNNNLALIDLDHIKNTWLKKIPERRRLRNLARFKKTLQRTDGMSVSDYGTFIRDYEKCLFSFHSRKYDDSPQAIKDVIV